MMNYHWGYRSNWSDLQWRVKLRRLQGSLFFAWFLRRQLRLVPRPILKKWWLISYYELNRPFKQFQRKKHHERHNNSKIFTSLTKKFHCSRVHLWNCLINDINTPNISIKSMFSIKNNNDNKVWHSWSFIIDINFEHYWSNYKIML